MLQRFQRNLPSRVLYSQQQIAPSLTVKVAQYGESLTPDVVLVVKKLQAFWVLPIEII